MDFKPEILRRFFNGKYSRKDYIWIKSVFSNPKNKEILRVSLKDHWNEFNNSSVETGNVDYLLQKIHHKIDKIESSSNRVRYLKIIRQIAAVLVIQLVLTFLAFHYFQNKKQPSETAYAEIECPLGARVKFNLPDGSSGCLNSGSKLKYPVLFKTNRDIKLSGEAWFNVKHDTLHPFVVKTKNLDIEVLGTCFNVIAYEDDLSEEVILSKGSVKIASESGQTLSILKPDQRLVLNTEKKTFTQDNLDASQYLAWTEGKLVFRNESMEQVAKRLGRWYNINIEIKDPELLEHAFRATFIDEPLDEVLKILAKTAPITYEIIERKQTTDNIYLKKHVILRFDKNRKEAS